jgi:hypothetical protein
MTLPGRGRQLAEQLFIACSEVGGMPKTPTGGNFHNRCVRLCRLDGPAYGAETLRSQIGYGVYTYHLFKRILQAAPAYAKHATKVGNARHFTGLRQRIITHSRNESATPARI